MNSQETWDLWHADAIQAGVSAELAQLGREVIRDHFQHGHNLTPEPGVWRLAEHRSYMRELALLAPNTAFTNFMAAKIWEEATGVDGDVEAFSLLVEHLGSVDRADEALAAEEAVAAKLLERATAEPGG